MNIGVLASHEGTTLQAVLDACAQGIIPAKVSVVISNNSGSGALRRAAAAGVRACHLSSKTLPDADELDRELARLLASADVDVVLLAGYMKKLGPHTLTAYAGRLLNTHPALLPKFGGEGMYGLNVHRAVLAAGDSETGSSVHLVEGEYDSGPVLAQCSVPVLAEDTPETLAARVQASERVLLVKVLAEIARGELSLPGQSTAR
jgi:phosphoribosylglycinamide formyltransferase-1